MDLFWKAVLSALIIALVGVVNGKEREFALLLSIAGAAFIAAVLITYLRPVFSFVKELESLGNLNAEHLKTITKAVGIGLVSEYAAVICGDIYGGKLEKMLQKLGNSIIIWLSIPVFQELLKLIQSILGEI